MTHGGPWPQSAKHTGSRMSLASKKGCSVRHSTWIGSLAGIRAAHVASSRVDPSAPGCPRHLEERSGPGGAAPVGTVAVISAAMTSSRGAGRMVRPSALHHTPAPTKPGPERPGLVVSANSCGRSGAAASPMAPAVAVPAAAAVPVATAATGRRGVLLEGVLSLDIARLLIGCLTARLASGLAHGPAVVVVRSADVRAVHRSRRHRTFVEEPR